MISNKPEMVLMHDIILWSLGKSPVTWWAPPQGTSRTVALFIFCRDFSELMEASLRGMDVCSAGPEGQLREIFQNLKNLDLSQNLLLSSWNVVAEMTNELPHLTSLNLRWPTIAHYCPLLSTIAHYCPLLPSIAHYCPLLSTIVHTIAHYCPLLSTIAHYCPLFLVAHWGTP